MSDLPHIVIMDDDLQSLSVLSNYLQRSGFQTTAVANVKALDRLLNRQRVDLIVLDPMLPGEDGLSICRQLRAEAHIPTIIMTARRSVLDRICALQVAQDYIAKPVDPRELLARLRNVLRRWNKAARRSTPKPKRYRLANWTLDTASQCLIGPDGKHQPLAGSEFRLFEALASNGNQVLSRGRLMQLTRGQEIAPFDRSIDVRISRLRQLLGEDARDASIIKTVYGEGYVIGVPVESE